MTTTPDPVNQMLLAALKGLLPSLLRKSAAMEKSDWDSVWIAHAAIAAAEQAPQPTDMTLDGMTPAQFALTELHKFQEATGCDTADQIAQPAELTDGEIYTAYIEATNQTLRAQDERLALKFARAVLAAQKGK